MVNSSRKNSLEPAHHNHKNFPDGRHPGFDANLDTVRGVWISKDKKPRDYLTQYIQDHNQDPGPIYEVGLDMTKQSIYLDNSPKYKIHKTNIPTSLEMVQK